ncbi:MAG TPA: GNAT family N-acetyltransferase, partial [Actinomycetota bacterium]|nr:GNAT family N-acetyltransferase [Actinomycetota bacterium]
PRRAPAAPRRTGRRTRPGYDVPAMRGGASGRGTGRAVRRPARRRGGADPAGRPIAVHPVTPERWDDLVRLFGERGAYGGCWCMFFRLPRPAFDRGARDGGAGNRAALRSFVADGRIPGLLAYAGDEPVGWVSVAPREEFGRVQRSAFGRASPPGSGVWAIVCFFVHRRHRGGGVARALLRAAVAHARAGGARAVEAYPVDPAVHRTDAAGAYVGVVSMFAAEGFREVARPYPHRPLMRRSFRTPTARPGAESRGPRGGRGRAGPGSEA